MHGRDAASDVAPGRPSLGPDSLSPDAVTTWSAPARLGDAPDELLLEPGDLVAGTYLVIELVGEGADSRVFHAHDRSLDRPVALKVLGAGRRLADVKREGVALARASHPNVVEVHTLVEHEGVPVLVLELQKRGSLASRVSTSTPEDAVYWLDGILAGLEALHSLGIVHRDLKPANILLGPFDEARLSDFGLATHVEDDATPLECTPAYCAPEAVLGAPVPRELRTAADFYSLGVLAFEVLTGTLPFDASEPFEVLRHHVMTAAPRVSSRRPELAPFDAWVASLLEKSPARRPRDTASLRHQLADALRVLRAENHGAPRVLIAESCIERARRLAAHVRAACPDLRLEIVLDGDQAAEALEKGAVDLLVTSLDVPGTSGLELCLLASSIPRSPAVVVALGASTKSGDWPVLQRLGASACILEPYDRDSVEIALRRALRWCAAPERQVMRPLAGV